MSTVEVFDEATESARPATEGSSAVEEESDDMSLPLAFNVEPEAAAATASKGLLLMVYYILFKDILSISKLGKWKTNPLIEKVLKNSLNIY